MLTARCSTAVTASSLDENRNPVNMQGMQLTGYPVAGTPSTVQTGANPQPINIPTTLMAAKATTTASQQINLNSTDTAPTTAFDPANPDTYNKKVRSPSLTAGNAHNMNLFYVKDATPANSPKVYAQTVAWQAARPLATTLTFNNNGTLIGGGNINLTTATIPGATPATFAMSFANSMQQNTGANNIVGTSQNGFKPGDRELPDQRRRHRGR